MLLVFAMFFGAVVGGLALLISFGPETLSNEYFRSAGDGRTRATLAIDLFLFVGFFVGLAVVLPLLHKRKIPSLLGSTSNTIRDFGVAALIYLVLSLIISLPVAFWEETTTQHSLSSVLAFLPLALVLILIQTGAEEFVFRGYVLQQLAVRFKSPWIWIVLPSVLFGILHYEPDIATEKALGIIVAISLSGILWADLVRVTGNLGAAWGWHFANNAMIMNFVGLNDTFNGFSWKVFSFGYADAPSYLFALDPIVSILTWSVLRRILGSR